MRNKLLQSLPIKPWSEVLFFNNVRVLTVSDMPTGVGAFLFLLVFLNVCLQFHNSLLARQPSPKGEAFWRTLSSFHIQSVEPPRSKTESNGQQIQRDFTKISSAWFHQTSVTSHLKTAFSPNGWVRTDKPPLLKYQPGFQKSISIQHAIDLTGQQLSESCENTGGAWITCQEIKPQLVRGTWSQSKANQYSTRLIQCLRSDFTPSFCGLHHYIFFIVLCCFF